MKRLCECGCGIEVKGFNSHTQRLIRFKQGHQIASKKIMPNYKGGIIFDGRYYKKMIPEHPFGNNLGYVYLHRLIYEEYHNCILLPYTDIHHIDEDTTNNEIDNLMPVYRGQHNQLRH